MKIIDSHVHFWHPQQLRYTWLDELNTINRPFLPDDLREAAGSIPLDGVVFVQADCAAEQGLDEARWVASLGSLVKGIVAFAPLEQGEGARSSVEALAQIPQVKSIRRLIQSEAAGFSIQPDFVTGVRLLAEYNLPFDLCIRHHQLLDVIKLVDECPNIRFVLDHVGKPNIAGGEIDEWRTNITKLAEFENVHCKLSGMVTEADVVNWQPADLQPYVEHVVSVFGTERVMFGSDWPVCLLASSYVRWFETLQQFLTALSDEQKQAIFAENAIRFYKLAA